MKSIYDKKVLTIFKEEKKVICEDLKYRYVYKIQFPNGKYYIGKHTTKNFNDGYCGSGLFLPKEFSENDKEKIIKEIVLFCNNKNDLNKAEEKIIGTLYKDDKNCLNVIRGGEGGYTEYMINKSANTRRGHKRSDESINKQRKACIGKRHSSETKQKMSKKRKMYLATEEGKKDIEKLKIRLNGRRLTEKEKNNLSEKAKLNFQNKGKDYWTKEGFEKMCIALKNYTFTEEDIKKRAESLKRHFAEHPEERKQKGDKLKKYYAEHPEVVEKIQNANKGKKVSEETRQKIREHRIGTKASEETRKKMSQERSGRKNARYCSDTIVMYNENEERTFIDCIEAVEYVRENINPKATGSEIFVACRSGKMRYSYYWKQIPKNDNRRK